MWFFVLLLLCSAASSTGGSGLTLFENHFSISPHDETGSVYFGQNGCVSNNQWLVVSAHDAGADKYGSVYIYDSNKDFYQKINGPTTTTNDKFGQQVTCAPGINAFATLNIMTKKIYIFELDTNDNQWKSQKNFSFTSANNQLGITFLGYDNSLLVSTNDGGAPRGVVNIYEQSSPFTWTQTTYLPSGADLNGGPIGSQVLKTHAQSSSNDLVLIFNNQGYNTYSNGKSGHALSIMKKVGTNLQYVDMIFKDDYMSFDGWNAIIVNDHLLAPNGYSGDLIAFRLNPSSGVIIDTYTISSTIGYISTLFRYTNNTLLALTNGSPDKFALLEYNPSSDEFEITDQVDTTFTDYFFGGFTWNDEVAIFSPYINTTGEVVFDGFRETTTNAPSVSPTSNPTGNPTGNPTESPTGSPTSNPTDNPTGNPTGNPTAAPSQTPSVSPSSNPTTNPTTGSPSTSPSKHPSSAPTTQSPSGSPSKHPTESPSSAPSSAPTSLGNIGGSGSASEESKSSIEEFFSDPENVKKVAGGAAGGLVGLAILVGLYGMYRKWRKANANYQAISP